MFRTNGGLIGKYRPPTIGAAPGIWSPAEQILAKQGQIWASNDPYFDKVSLLMHMEGPNNSTDFIDSSFNNLTITKSGSGTAVITTSSKKFGSSCLSISNHPTNLRTPISTLFNFGLAIDFTVELWVKANSYDNVQRKLITFVANGNYTYPPFELYSQNRNFGWFIANSTLNSIVSNSYSDPGIMPETVWHHVAIVGYNGTLTVYFNGISRVSVTLPSWPNIPRGLIIGQEGGSNTVVWEFDEIRVTKGVARYTSNFTVPNSQFADG